MSGLFKLNWQDFVKGLIVAALSGGLGAIYGALTAGEVLTATVLKTAGLSAITGGVGYLMKNLATNSQGQVLTPEPPKTT